LPEKFFEVVKNSGSARFGKIYTSHGEIQTPNFMPVATAGAIKAGISPQDLREIGAEIMLSNAFHLHLRPGENLIENFGGIQKFSGWNGPMLTDSGGFQVFSLAKLRKISDAGVEFRSPIDGQAIFISPEKSIQIQHSLGADIIMIFDECPPGNSEKKEIEKAVLRTSAWAEICQKTHHQLLEKSKKSQKLFGIVQGGIFLDLRQQSAEKMMKLNFPGVAIGGLSVGEPAEKMIEVCSFLNPILPKNKPRYLMGVGTPKNLVEMISCGIDLFDCVLPTRNGRHGKFYTFSGGENIKNKINFDLNSPLEKDCDCLACRNFSRGFLRHLFLSKEILGSRMLAIHNLRFYFRLLKKIRQEILDGTFEKFANSFLQKFKE